MIIAKNGPVQKDDIVTMDYVELDGDGKEVEGTKRDDFSFTVGSSYNFYKLDDDIVGMKAGETKVIEKTYGDDSGMGSDYLGKTVKIRVSIKEVKFKDVPDLDDEFAQDVKDSYKTLKDLKEDTKKQLQEKAEIRNKSHKLEAILAKLAENTKIEMPASMIQTQLDQEWRGFAQRFGMSEEEVEKLMTANGSTKESFLDSRRADVIQDIKRQLILDKISEQQKFEIPEEEIDAKLKEYDQEITSDHPNYDLMKSYVKDDMLFAKAQDYLVENNKFKEKKDNAKK